MPLDRIRHHADVSVKRACGFATLAIWTMMAGCAFRPLMAIRAGAILFTLAGVVLFYMASRAGKVNYRHTELWILLDKRHGLPEDRAQAIIGGIRREVLAHHAHYAAYVAGSMWLLAFGLRLLGFGGPG